MSDTTYSAPTIASAYDDTGLSVGTLSSGASTDDRAPDFTVSLSGTGAAAGDTVSLSEDGAVAVQHVLTASEVSAGDVVLTPPIVGLGTHTVTAAVTSGGTTGPASAGFSFTVAADPAVSGAPQSTAYVSLRGANVPLYNGAHLDVSNNDNTHVWQMYDANGLALGARQALDGPEPAVGLWGVAASPTGGYVFLGDQMTSNGSRLVVADYAADGTQIGSDTTLTAGQPFGASVAQNGGFLVDYSDGAPLPDGNTQIYSLFNAQAQEVGTVEFAGQVTGVTAQSNGVFDIAWNDAGTSRTFVFDPSDTSHATLMAAPAMTIEDDQGAQTGAVAAGGTTDDTTPTLRVAVSQVGEVHANLMQGGATLGTDTVVQVTSADVTRGYVDVTLNADKGDGAYTAEARAVDASGAASPWDQQSFTLDTSGSGGGSGGGTTGGASGQDISSPGAYSNVSGGSGDDTITASAGGDTLTGGAGADDFVFKTEPWSPVHITDFTVGTDRLDLSALLSASGYTGSDPVADRYVTLQSDGSGGTEVLFDPDGTATAHQWPDYIIDLQGAQVSTWAQLTGSASTGGGTGGTGGTGGGDTGGGSAGQDITSPGAYSDVSGGAGDDTITASAGGDTLTGGGGADDFVFNSEPWSPVHITDFSVGADRLDLSGMLKAAGYTGSDPVTDHYIILQSDGAGGTEVLFDPDGTATAHQWPDYIIDLQGAQVSTWAQLTGSGATGGGSTGGTGGTGGGDTGTGSTGQDITSPGAYSSVSGGPGDDTITASAGGDTLTGGAGADVFAFSSEPWSPVHITDFQAGSDKIDLSAVLKAAGYTGSDPIADHYVSVIDLNGGAGIEFDPDGAGTAHQWPDYIIQVEGVSAAQLTASNWLIA